MEGKGFRWIQLRKRRDRVGQALVIISGMGMMGMGARCLVKSVARVLGVKDAVVGGGMAGLIGLMGFARMMLQKMGKERALRLAL